jgi:large subunit ribosomal protein L41
LKPYVSYRVPEVNQSEFTAKDLFNVVYRSKIINDFNKNKLKENGEPLEPNEEESLTPEQAKARARQTGCDLFSEGR